MQIFIILVFSSLAVHLSLTLPFYFSWDMDLITITDMLLMKSNMLPAHINHPGMGMYWLLENLQTLAQEFGLITKVAITDLFTSIEPMLVLAEQSVFMRICNALVCIGVSVALWLTTRKEFSDSKILDTLLLLVFLTIPGFWRYDMHMIRTESYSIFFWAISLYYTLRASEEKIIGTNALLAGFFASLSFFTKIQVFFLLPLLGLLYQLRQTSEKEIAPLYKYRFWVFISVFILMTIVSIFASLPSYKADFAQRYWLNKFFFAFVLLLYFIKRAQKFERLKNLTHFLSAFLIGAALVVFLPVFSSMKFLTGLQYGFASFKLLFLRITRFADLGQLDILNNLQILIAANWKYLLIAFLVIGISWYKTKKHIVFALVSVLMLAQITLGVRSGPQDSMWAEIPFLVAAVLFSYSAHRWAAYLVFPALLCLNIQNTTGFRKFELSRTIAYYDSLMYFNGVFIQGEYTQSMYSRYPTLESKNNAILLGNRVGEIKSVLANNFANSDVTLKDVTGTAETWIVSMRAEKDSSVYLFYRPDQTQKIYFPEGTSPDFKLENCDKTPAPEITFQGKKHIGFSLKGLIGKGRETPTYCVVTTDQLKNSVIVVQPYAQATFVGY